ncbi:MAG: hypothetical protein ACLT2T_11195 [Bilophila wadsworthia]
MSDILLWMHPLMQACAAVLGVWAMWQGLKRVAMLLGKKTLFPWKRQSSGRWPSFYGFLGRSVFM